MKKLILAIIALALLALPVSAAPATSTSCGEVTASLQLTSDITSTGTCLNVTSGNVVIDCAGHTITFNTAGNTASINILSAAGILAEDVNGVTVRNCNMLSEYGNNVAAIYFDNGTNHRVEANTVNISAQGSGRFASGIYFNDVSESDILQNSIRVNQSSNLNAWGIKLIGKHLPSFGTFNNTISHNTVLVAGHEEQVAAIELHQVKSNTVTDNSFTAIGDIVVGASLIVNSPQNTFTGNTYNVVNILRRTVFAGDNIPDGSGIKITSSALNTFENENIIIRGDNLTAGLNLPAFFSNTGETRNTFRSITIDSDATTKDYLGTGSDTVPSNNDTVRELQLTRAGITVSFDEGSTSLKGIPASEAPYLNNSLNKFLKLSKEVNFRTDPATVDAWSSLAVHYTDSEVQNAGVEENCLALVRHNGTGWTKDGIGEQGVDSVNNKVYGKVTSMGYIGVVSGECHPGLQIWLSPETPTIENDLTATTDPFTNIINWYKNGQNYNRVNIPFEHNTTDYVQNILGEGNATYTTGRDGGAAIELLNTNLTYNSALLQDSSFTLSIWAKTQHTGITGILRQYEPTTCEEFVNLYYNGSHVVFQVRDTKHNVETVTAPVNLQQWTHIAVRSSSTLDLFIDGTLAASVPSTLETQPTGSKTQLASRSGCGCQNNWISSVQLDDLQVLGTVSDSQISLLSENAFTISKDELKDGDTWKACAILEGQQACDEATVKRDLLPSTALMHPGDGTKVLKGEPFTVTARVTCEGTQSCKDIEAILDPRDSNGDGYYTDDADCAQSTMCDYTYSGECNTNYCGVGDGCDCWWPEYDYSGQSCCGGTVYGPDDGGMTCDAVNTITDSPDPYSYSYNTLTEQCWLKLNQTGQLIEDVTINYEWDTDGYPEEGSFWIKSPSGTTAKIAEQQNDGTYEVKLTNFRGEDSTGVWEIWIEDSYGDGGHQVRNLSLNFEEKVGVFLNEITKPLITKGTALNFTAELFLPEPLQTFSAYVTPENGTTQTLQMTQLGDILRSSQYTLAQYGNFTVNVTVSTQNYTYHDWMRFSTSDKGIIPQGAGEPFFTLDANIKDKTHVACLGELQPGESCYVSWTVNATGENGTSWQFFAEFTGGVQATTNIIELTIDSQADKDSTPPPCSDGSPEGACSATQPLSCTNGQLQPECTQCGCPTDKRCMNDPQDPEYNTCICKDECITGARICSGTGYQTCGNYDTDRCTEWSETKECLGEMTCQAGDCVYEGPINENVKLMSAFEDDEVFLMSPSAEWENTLPWNSVTTWQEFNDTTNKTQITRYDLMMYHDETGFIDVRQLNSSMTPPHPISQLAGTGVECGSVIENGGVYTLNKDLTPLAAPNNRNDLGISRRECIYVNAPQEEVVIDCQGHTIDCGTPDALAEYTTKPDDDYYCYNDRTNIFHTFATQDQMEDYINQTNDPDDYCGLTPSVCKDKNIEQCANTQMTCSIVQGSGWRHWSTCGQSDYDEDNNYLEHPPAKITLQNCKIKNCKELNFRTPEIVIQGNTIETYDEPGLYSKAYWTMHPQKSSIIHANIFNGRGDLRIFSPANASNNLTYNRFNVSVQDALNASQWYSGNAIDFNIEVDGKVQFTNNFINMNTTGKDKHIEENRHDEGNISFIQLGEGYGVHIWGKSRGAGEANISNNIFFYDVSPLRSGINAISLRGGKNAIVKNNLYWVKQHPINVSFYPGMSQSYDNRYSTFAGTFFLAGSGCENCTISNNVMYFQGLRKNETKTCAQVFGANNCANRTHGSEANNGYVGFDLAEIQYPNNYTKVYNNYLIMDGDNRAPAIRRMDSSDNERDYEGLQVRNLSVFMAMNEPVSYEENGTTKYRAPLLNETVFNRTRPIVHYDGYPGQVFGYNYSREVIVQHIPFMSALATQIPAYGAMHTKGINIMLLNNSGATELVLNSTAEGLTLQSGNSSKIEYRAIDPLLTYDYLSDNDTVLPILGLHLQRKVHYIGTKTDTYPSLNITVPETLIATRYNSTGEAETYTISPTSLRVYRFNESLEDSIGERCEPVNVSVENNGTNETTIYFTLDHEKLEYVVQDEDGNITEGPVVLKSPRQTLCCKAEGNNWTRTCTWQHFPPVEYVWENLTINLNLTTEHVSKTQNLTLAIMGEPAGFDIDNVLNRINSTWNRTSPARISILQDTPPEIQALLNDTLDLSSSELRKLKTKEYFSFWQSFDTAVWSDANYETSLHAATYAAAINAPLVIENTLNESEQEDYLSGVKQIICIGNPEDASCTEKYSVRELQKEYLKTVNKTAGIVIVNPRDHYSPTFGTVMTDNSGQPVTKLHYQLSALGPVLASSKGWLLATDTSGRSTDMTENLKYLLEAVNEEEHEFRGITAIGDVSKIEFILPHEMNLTPLSNKSRILPRVDRVAGITVADASGTIQELMSNNLDVVDAQVALDRYIDTTNRYIDKLSAPVVKTMLGGELERVHASAAVPNAYLLKEGRGKLEGSNARFEVTDCPIVVMVGLANVTQRHYDRLTDEYGCYATATVTGPYVTRAQGKLSFEDGTVIYEGMDDSAIFRRMKEGRQQDVKTEYINVESYNPGTAAELYVKHAADLINLTEADNTDTFATSGLRVKPKYVVVQRGDLNITVESNGTNSWVQSPLKYDWYSHPEYDNLKIPHATIRQIESDGALVLQPLKSLVINLGNATQPDQTAVINEEGLVLANFSWSAGNRSVDAAKILISGFSSTGPFTEGLFPIDYANMLIKARSQYTLLGFAKGDYVNITKTPGGQAKIVHVNMMPFVHQGEVLVDTDGDGKHDATFRDEYYFNRTIGQTARSARTEPINLCSPEAREALNDLAAEPQVGTTNQGLHALRTLTDLEVKFFNGVSKCEEQFTRFMEDETLAAYKNIIVLPEFNEILSAIAFSSAQNCLEADEMSRAYVLLHEAEQFAVDEEIKNQAKDMKETVLSRITIQMAQIEAHEIYRMAMQHFHPNSLLSGIDFYASLSDKPYWERALAGLSGLAPYNVYVDYVNAIEYDETYYNWHFEDVLQRGTMLNRMIESDYADNIDDAMEILQMAADFRDKRNPGSYMQNNVWEMKKEAAYDFEAPAAYLFEWDELPGDYWYALSLNNQGTEGWLRDKSNLRGLDYNGYFNGTELYMVDPIDWEAPLGDYDNVPLPKPNFSGYVLWFGRNALDAFTRDVSTAYGVRLLNDSEYAKLAPCLQDSNTVCQFEWLESDGSDYPMVNHTTNVTLRLRDTPYQWEESILSDYQQQTDNVWKRQYSTNRRKMDEKEHSYWFAERMSRLIRAEFFKARETNLQLAHVQWPIWDPTYKPKGGWQDDPRTDESPIHAMPITWEHADYETLYKLESAGPGALSTVLYKGSDIINNRWSTYSNITFNVSVFSEQGQNLLLDYAEDLRYEHGHLETAVMIGELIRLKPANSQIDVRADELVQSVVNTTFWQQVTDVWNFQDAVKDQVIATLTNPFEIALWELAGLKLAKVASLTKLGGLLKAFNYVRELPTRVWGVRLLKSQMMGVPVKMSLTSLNGARNVAAMGTLIASDLALDYGVQYAVFRTTERYYGKEAAAQISIAAGHLMWGLSMGADGQVAAIHRARKALGDAGEIHKWGTWINPVTQEAELVITHTGPLTADDLRIARYVDGGELVHVEERAPGVLSARNRAGDQLLPLRFVRLDQVGSDTLRSGPYHPWPISPDDIAKLQAMRQSMDAGVSLIGRELTDTYPRVKGTQPQKQGTYQSGDIVEYIDFYDGGRREGIVKKLQKRVVAGEEGIYIEIYDVQRQMPSIVKIEEIVGRKNRLDYVKGLGVPESESMVVDILSVPDKEKSSNPPMQVIRSDGTVRWLKLIKNNEYMNYPEYSPINEYVTHSYVKDLSETHPDWPETVKVPSIKSVSETDIDFNIESININKLEDPRVQNMVDWVLKKPEDFAWIEHAPGTNVYQSAWDFGEEFPIQAYEDWRKALQIMNENGIVHQDFHGGNVMLAVHEDGSYTATILDFGLSKMEQQYYKSGRPLRESRIEYVSRVIKDIHFVQDHQRGYLRDYGIEVPKSGPYIHRDVVDITLPEAVRKRKSHGLHLKCEGRPDSFVNVLEDATDAELDALETTLFGAPRTPPQ